MHSVISGTAVYFADPKKFLDEEWPHLEEVSRKLKQDSNSAAETADYYEDLRRSMEDENSRLEDFQARLRQSGAYADGVNVLPNQRGVVTILRNQEYLFARIFLADTPNSSPSLDPSSKSAATPSSESKHPPRAKAFLFFTYNMPERFSSCRLGSVPMSYTPPLLPREPNEEEDHLLFRSLVAMPDSECCSCFRKLPKHVKRNLLTNLAPQDMVMFGRSPAPQIPPEGLKFLVRLLQGGVLAEGLVEEEAKVLLKSLPLNVAQDFLKLLARTGTPKSLLLQYADQDRKLYEEFRTMVKALAKGGSPPPKTQDEEEGEEEETEAAMKEGVERAHVSRYASSFLSAVLESNISDAEKPILLEALFQAGYSTVDVRCTLGDNYLSSFAPALCCVCATASLWTPSTPPSPGQRLCEALLKHGASLDEVYPGAEWDPVAYASAAFNFTALEWLFSKKPTLRTNYVLDINDTEAIFKHGHFRFSFKDDEKPVTIDGCKRGNAADLVLFRFLMEYPGPVYKEAERQPPYSSIYTRPAERSSGMHSFHGNDNLKSIEEVRKQVDVLGQSVLKCLKLLKVAGVRATSTDSIIKQVNDHKKKKQKASHVQPSLQSLESNFDLSPERLISEALASLG